MEPDIFAFLSYVVVVSFTPGPNNILVMSFAAKLGYRKTLHYISGVFVGFATLTLAAAYFNIFLPRLLPALAPYLKTAGAFYVLYLMYKVLTETLLIPGGCGAPVSECQGNPLCPHRDLGLYPAFSPNPRW